MSISAPRVPSLLLWGGLAVLLGSGIAWFFEHFDRRTEFIDLGFSPEARKNEFLAAERFLQRIGRSAESRPGWKLLRTLPSSRDVLLVGHLGPLNAQRQQQLRRWIEAGGHLILSPPKNQHRDRNFLHSLGVELREQPDCACQPPRMAEVYFPQDTQPLKMQFDPRYALIDRRQQAIGIVLSADGQIQGLQFSIGAGLLSVFSDLKAFTNRWIGEQDHALILARLTEVNESGKVWLLYAHRSPWLGARLWATVPQVLLAGGLFVLLWLWHLTGRLGPFLPAPQLSRRDWSAHFQALGDFHQRQGSVPILAASAQHRIESAWLHRNPRLRGSNLQARRRWIARKAGLSEAEVARAFRPLSQAPGHWVEAARLLQRLEQALHPRS